ncbi:hypothetical protein M2354_002006 [Leclercia adecarboxylata]|uniref:hypothetical protein n=1 Tax=Leclercia adecarboxylata TaxID=83655 RepID=UPI00247552B0|nr:hypothetical protein [Leclercia adecarboxylata]MDH6162351.1 hypothetical protein [Leclercia adecarboxylata]
MSLQLRMKLTDLEQEETRLVESRGVFWQPKKLEVIGNIKDELKAYLEAQGLQLEYKDKVINGIYNGQNFISVNLTDFAPADFGQDGVIFITYNNKKYSVVLRLDRPDNGSSIRSFSGTERDILEQKIKYYEENLLPKLRQDAMKQLPGTYTLHVSQDGKGQPEKYNSIDSLLKSFLD